MNAIEDLLNSIKKYISTASKEYQEKIKLYMIQTKFLQEQVDNFKKEIDDLKEKLRYQNAKLENLQEESRIFSNCVLEILSKKEGDHEKEIESTKLPEGNPDSNNIDNFTKKLELANIQSQCKLLDANIKEKIADILNNEKLL